MNKAFIRLCGAIALLVVSAGALPSCKGFNAGPKADAAPGDLADAGPDARSGSGGSAAPGTGGIAVVATGGSGGDGNTHGSGGVAAGSGGAGGSGVSMCSSSQHQCSGVCVDNASIDSCGTKCDRCKPPAGATATCDGTLCDFTCGSGMKKCAAGSICVPAAGCCSSQDCPAQASGQTGTCDSGTHTCNYGCPANSQSCTVGGTTSCIPAAGCCQNSDCAGECQTCSAASHTCVAAANMDDPNGRCSGTCDATGTCKSKRGQTCTTTKNGCLAGSTCSPDGYCCDQACTASCLACDLAGKEGTCTPVASGAPHTSHTACTGYGTLCGGTCGNRADGLCVYPTGACDVAACGVNGARPASTCNNGTCVQAALVTCANGCDATRTSCLSCASGQTGCQGTCRNLSNDPQNCGSCLNVCDPPQSPTGEMGGVATCSGSQCGFTCNTNFTKCPGTPATCARSRWDFEDGTTQGFVLRTDIDVEQSAVINSTARAHTGTHSVALPLKAAGGLIDLNSIVCGLQVPTAGRSISAWFYMDGPLNSSQANEVAVSVWGCGPQSDGSIGCIPSFGQNNSIPIGSWFQVSWTVPDSFAASEPSSQGFTISGNLFPSGSATTLYVDDVVFQ